MNEIFAPYIGKFVLVYLDDILIFSKTQEAHREHVADLLREHKHTVRAAREQHVNEGGA